MRSARSWTTALGLAAAGLITAGAKADEPPVYELRTYTTAPGKLPVLVGRFGESNRSLFAKHGIELVGAWTPTEPGDAGERLIYLVRFPSRQAAADAWAAFGADPVWKELFAAEKQAHGEVVTKAEGVFLAPTDYSPAPAAGESGPAPALYELRTYTASPGRLEKLNERFRDHTLGLFEKHGMRNVFYGVPTDVAAGADDTLIYLLAHRDRAAADASWKAFGEDPEWQAVYAASQADGVKLAAKVERVYLTPTASSPLN